MADGNYVHIRCMAHTLHLVVTAALKECRGVTNVTARKITGFVHRSNKAALKTALTNLKVDADVQALPEALKMVTTLWSQLAQHFQAVFDDSSGHYFKATLLDPRFKSLHMSLLSTEFDRLKADVAAEVDTELQANDVSGVPEAASSSSVESETSGRKSLFWGAMHILAKPKAKSASSGAMTSLKIIESYLAEDSTESMTSDPAVTFWSKMMQPQPTQAHVAMKYLTCPPTSVPTSLQTAPLTCGGACVHKIQHGEI
ncbi:zinc finger BED domain-containing protein 4-like isoform X1 [Tachysurus ichikawai]